MHLITMAHTGEAQGVIDNFTLKKTSHDIYQGENVVLLITGEGPFEAATKTALAINKYGITEIINLGIAGSLNPSYAIGSIHEVRTIYLLQDLKPQFKTFQSSNKGLDCLTSFERILDPHKAEKLKGLGELIDRECWGVAHAAKTAGIPFSSWKVISDFAGSIDACEVVQEKAQEYALVLSEKLTELLKKKSAEVKTLELKDFYFTFTSSHRFKTLLSKLSIKEERTEDDLIANLPLDDLRSIKTTPKDRAKRLIDLLEDRIDPTRKTLETKRKNWEKDFIAKGFQVKTDPDWENPEIQISFNVKDDSELATRLDTLKELSVTPFQNLMNGQIYVE